MRKIKLNYLIEKTQESFLAYPLTILSALCSVLLGIFLFEYEDNIKNPFPYLNLLLTFALGIPLYFSVTFLSGAYLKKNTFKIISYGIATFFLILIYFSLPNQELTFNTHTPYIRYIIYNGIIHLFVSFIPFLHNNGLNGFWNYNKTLFIRFWTAILYSFVLYLGIILAITAIKLLFDFSFNSKIYGDIFILIFGLFNTWFFVAGIPKKNHYYESLTSYPKGLKIFSQYTLLPLLIIYLLILYTYGSKIIITNNWPRGIVSYLISAISILGILTFLLLHPYGKQKEYKWIQKLSYLYYLLLIPLIVLLFIAIFTRINQYGITIKRSLVFLLGLWLSIVTLYFCLKKKNIKLIPISLALILFISSFGPWGIFNLSEKSQSKRLLSILEKHNLIKNGKVINEVIWDTSQYPDLKALTLYESTNKIPDSIHNEIKSILDYLDNYHGLNTIKPFLKQDLVPYFKVAINKDRHINEARVYMKTLGLNYSKFYDRKKSLSKIYNTKKSNIVSTFGFDYYIPLPYLYNQRIHKFNIKNNSYKISLDKSNIHLTSLTDSIIIQPRLQLKKLDESFTDNRNQVPKEQLQFTGIIDNISFLIQLNELRILKTDKGFSIKNLDGYLLFNTGRKQ